MLSFMQRAAHQEEQDYIEWESVSFIMKWWPIFTYMDK